jgi:hypothetical protein
VHVDRSLKAAPLDLRADPDDFSALKRIRPGRVAKLARLAPNLRRSGVVDCPRSGAPNGPLMSKQLKEWDHDA